jgi:thiol-disulfide isomerase/thioredoxin
MMFPIGRSANRIAFWAMAAWLVAGPAAAQEPLKNFILLDQPKAVAAINFDDGQGRARSLADFRGKVVLLNIWATWCIPCRKEMPALDRLQASLGGPDFEVVPVSIDRGGRDTVAKFYAEAGIRNLAMYVDASGQTVRTLDAVGLPTTLIIDRAGNEIDRVIGPLEWDAPEIAEFLRQIVLKQNDVAESLTQEPQAQIGRRDHDPPGSLQRAFRWLVALFIN